MASRKSDPELDATEQVPIRGMCEKIVYSQAFVGRIIASTCVPTTPLLYIYTKSVPIMNIRVFHRMSNVT